MFAAGSGWRVSRFGNPYRVSSKRRFRQALTQILGYCARPAKPRTKGCWRWMSEAERAQIAALTAQGRSGREIARMMKRAPPDRRSVAPAADNGRLSAFSETRGDDTGGSHQPVRAR